MSVYQNFARRQDGQGRLWRCFLPLIALLIMVSMAVAQVPQSAETSSSSTQPDIATQIQTVTQQLEQFQQTYENLTHQFAQADDDLQMLANLRPQLADLSNGLHESGLTLRNPLQRIVTRLEQLAAADSDGTGTTEQTEQPDNAQLQQQRSEINALMERLENLYLQVNDTQLQIHNQRRAVFTANLTHKTVLDSALRVSIIHGAETSWHAIGQLFSSWWHYVWHYKLGIFLLALIGPFLGAGALFWLENIYIDRWIQKNASEPRSDTYLHRLLVMIVRTLAPSIALAVFLSLSWSLLNAFRVFNPEMRELFAILFQMIGLVFFVARLTAALLSPSRPHLQLVRIAPWQARILVTQVALIVSVIAFDNVLETLFRIVSAPFALSIAKSFLSVIAISLLIMSLVLVRPRIDPHSGEIRPWPRWLVVLMWLFALVPLGTLFLGYVGLARFMSEQVVIISAFVIFIVIGIQTGRTLSAEQGLTKSLIGQWLQTRFDLGPRQMDQIGLISGLLVIALTLAVAIPPVLLELGFQWHEITDGFINLITGFQLGNITISLVAIFSGIISFFVVLAGLFWLRGWIDRNVLMRSHVDSGIRNSVKTVLGYVIFAVSVLAGVSVAGFNLSTLAWVAGGLSIGIGFGLQNIFQNFVSGLILLVERPFKLGDKIEVGAVKGTVRRISVRATEVETAQRQMIIVPNSTLINGNVGNWTHHNKMGRVDIDVIVPIKDVDDPRKAHDLLLELANDMPQILKNPAPSARFVSYDATNFNFKLYLYVADITQTGDLSNEINYRLYQSFPTG